MAAAVRAVPGVRVLDVQSDAVAQPLGLYPRRRSRGARRRLPPCSSAPSPQIDLRTHTGEHPRLGAVDVVPFVPIEGATMADCVALARRRRARSPTRFDVPVFLYEEAATQPPRAISRTSAAANSRDSPRRCRSRNGRPTSGPPRRIPAAGASVIGARMPLIAYNINLATHRLDVAKKIAAACA